MRLRVKRTVAGQAEPREEGENLRVRSKCPNNASVWVPLLFSVSGVYFRSLSPLLVVCDDSGCLALLSFVLSPITVGMRSLLPLTFRVWSNFARTFIFPARVRNCVLLVGLGGTLPSRGHIRGLSLGGFVTLPVATGGCYVLYYPWFLSVLGLRTFWLLSPCGVSCLDIGWGGSSLAWKKSIQLS